ATGPGFRGERQDDELESGERARGGPDDDVEALPRAQRSLDVGRRHGGSLDQFVARRTGMAFTKRAGVRGRREPPPGAGQLWRLPRFVSAITMITNNATPTQMYHWPYQLVVVAVVVVVPELLEVEVGSCAQAAAAKSS